MLNGLQLDFQRARGEAVGEEVSHCLRRLPHALAVFKDRFVRVGVARDVELVTVHDDQGGLEICLIDDATPTLKESVGGRPQTKGGLHAHTVVSRFRREYLDDPAACKKSYNVIVQ